MKLIYFTSSYPFGLGEQWKMNELNELVHRFDEIVVVPYSYDANFDNPKTLPPGVSLAGPLFRESSIPVKRVAGLCRIVSSRYRVAFIRELFNGGAYKKRSHFMSWLGASLNVIRLLKHPVIRKIIENADKQTILYFFWGKGASEILPFIDNSLFFKTFVRMHRYDLFETVNNNYIPYRRRLLESINIAAPSSEAGVTHLLERYPDLAHKIKLFKLGTLGNGKQSKPSADGTFRVVSCSYLSPVKRVRIMVESLQYVDFPILWRHVGDGAERQEIEDLIRKYDLEQKFIIEGIIDTRKLLDFYTSDAFDLFVNVSSSEGIPMSIMEALSVSIPVMATNVGGIGELVDDAVGRLLPATVTPVQLADELKHYYALAADEKASRRQNAFKKAETECNAVRLAAELSDFLYSRTTTG